MIYGYRAAFIFLKLFVQGNLQISIYRKPDVHVILGFILHDVIHIESHVIALAGASFLMIFESPKRVLNGVEWNTIFFFIGLFIIIGGFEAAGGIKIMAQ